MGRPLALVIVAILATGCATRASYHRLTNDVATLRGEVTDVRQQQEATTRELARTVAENHALDARLNELNTAHKDAVTEVAALKARLETAETTLHDVKLATTPPPSAPALAPAPVRIAPAPVRPIPITRPPVPERHPAPAPRPSAPREADGPTQAYHAALETFHAREYGQAVLDLLDFVAKYPTHPLAANAQYWIGEAYYVQRDFRQALVEFQKVVDGAPPTSEKVPDALLKIGLCYRNLRDENHARQMWDRVEKDYPQSQSAAKARTLLRTKGVAARR
jgi:tol-pal system protein YbgF